MNEDYEVHYWTKHLNISKEKLQKIVDKVGIQPPLSARNWRCDKACGMLAISEARPARFSIADYVEQLLGSEGLL
jgi:hypothetical protein